MQRAFGPSKSHQPPHKGLQRVDGKAGSALSTGTSGFVVPLPGICFHKASNVWWQQDDIKAAKA